MKLPVYLVLDASGGMMGEPIATLEAGVENFVNELKQNPIALETVYISIITYGSCAKQIVPLTEISEFKMPSIRPAGTVALGDALLLLDKKIDSEVIKDRKRGDRNPLVFIFSFRDPTDNWLKGLAEFRKQKTDLVVACAGGQEIVAKVFKQITTDVEQLDTVDSMGIKECFKQLYRIIILPDDSWRPGHKVYLGD